MKNKGHERQRQEPFRRMNDQRRGIGSGPMISNHVMGKTTPGGVHEGIIRSRKSLDGHIAIGPCIVE
jgi:hypothetical protein